MSSSFNTTNCKKQNTPKNSANKLNSNCIKPGSFDVKSPLAGYIVNFPYFDHFTHLNRINEMVVKVCPTEDRQTLNSFINGTVEVIDREGTHIAIREAETNIRVDLYIGIYETQLPKEEQIVKTLVNVGDKVTYDSNICEVNFHALGNLTNPCCLIVVQNQWYPDMQVKYLLYQFTQVPHKKKLMIISYQNSNNQG